MRISCDLKINDGNRAVAVYAAPTEIKASAIIKKQGNTRNARHDKLVEETAYGIYR